MYLAFGIAIYIETCFNNKSLLMANKQITSTAVGNKMNTFLCQNNRWAWDQ